MLSQSLFVFLLISLFILTTINAATGADFFHTPQDPPHLQTGMLL